MKKWLIACLCALSAVALACSPSDGTSENGNPSQGDSQTDGSNNNNNNDDNTQGDGTTNIIVVTRPSQTCANHEQLCDDGICRDVKTSVSNCGRCGNACNAGETCVNGECYKCTDTRCGLDCVDITSHREHCGGCNQYCGQNMDCVDSECTCAPEYYDCDGDPSNGCENYGGCICIVGTEFECYYGPQNTAGIGECRAGVMRCTTEDDAIIITPCEGVVTPRNVPFCSDKDYNCNGTPDGQEDADGDGYTICDGDCCDNEIQCNANNPELINPGMMEVLDNGIDDNCNYRIDEPELTADDVTPISYTYGTTDLDTTARAMAQAMGIIDICEPNQTCAHGLINAKLTRASTTYLPDKSQVNIVDALRDANNIARVLPREGKTFAMMSSGVALDVKSGVSKDDKAIEKYASETMIGGEMQRESKESKIPDIYQIVHNNKLQTHEACPTGTVKPAIFDSVQLHLELKVPVNAKGIQFDFRFFSREYPSFVCSAFNDFFLAMLTTTHEELANYPDKNIAFDKLGNPVSINNGFFTTCRKIPCSPETATIDCPAFMTCGSDNYCTAGADTCQDGDTAISAYYPEPYAYSSGRGGGTAWLSTTAPVVGGETIMLDFYIWDTQDNIYDSTVLLDNFKWLVDETKVNTGFAEDEVIN